MIHEGNLVIPVVIQIRERQDERERPWLVKRQKYLETPTHMATVGNVKEGSLSGFMTMVGKGEQWWVEEET